MAYVDAMIGEVLNGLADDIHVLLTADAGQSLGEHGHVGAGRPSLYQEVVHVPLLLVGPGCRAGLHVAAVTASIDLAPTIADLAGATLDGAHGRSLLPLLAHDDPPWRDHVALGTGPADAPLLGLWSPDWALHLPADEGAALFVKPDDRWEVNDVAKPYAEWVDKVAAALRAEVQATHQPGPLDVPPLPALDDAEESDPT
ncbi:MAG: sulfatase-like hydrolase/transferase [Gemmataceae bacterium]